MRLLKFAAVLFLSTSILFSGCAGSPKLENIENVEPKSSPEMEIRDGDSKGNSGVENDSPSPDESGGQTPEESVDEGDDNLPFDVFEVKPNEAGKIMVVMFHNFVEAYKSGDKLFTTTFDEFRKLLQTLYDGGYRLISLSDYLSNNISVPAGCIPMVFTFDDGTAGQFNLVEENGGLTANRRSAVGIMEEFNESHPDFGLKGTFFVNLGLNMFPSRGTLSERLQYLIDKGFEIGNHTLTHIDLSKAGDAEKIQQEIGGNQKKMYELIPGYKMISFSLPYGSLAKDLQGYVVKGSFEGIDYEHLAVVEVGWDPAPSPVSKQFKPLSTHRVRASGIEPVDADLAWWLERLSKDEQYISDGNPNTITVPKSKEDSVDLARLNGKKLILY